MNQRLLGTLVHLPLALFAASASSSETAAAVPSGSVAIMQTLFGLFLVLALIYGLAWLSKRLSGGALGGNKLLKIAAVLPLGAREKIILINAGGQQIMVGVTPGHISTLHVFNQPLDAQQDAVATETGNSSFFAQDGILKAAVGRKNSANTPTESSPNNPQKNTDQTPANSGLMLAARSASEFSRKLNHFLNQGNKS